MSLPFISLSTCTFNRVSNLEETVESFLRMEYGGRKELVIYNNSESQELVYSHPEIRVINAPRQPTLGDIRNFCIEQCQGDVISAADDDDIFLPNHLENLAALLKDYDYARWTNYFFVKGHQVVDICAGNGNFVVFRKDAWRKCGGYPSMNAGEDIEFSRRLKEHCNGGLFEMPREKASFLYCWGQPNSVYHISGKGFDIPGEPTAHERIAEDARQKLATGEIPSGRIVLKPHWKIDWAAAAREFLQSQAPKVVQPQELELVDGFPVLSIVIGVLNEQEELLQTIASIRETAGGRPEIIVIDDCSDTKLTVPPDVKLWRNPVRLGCGASRHLGACRARGKFLVFLDAHMRFEPGWYEEATRRIQANPDVLYCTVCLGLCEGMMEMTTYPRNEKSKDVKIGTLVAIGNKSYAKKTDRIYVEAEGDQTIEVEPDSKVGLAAVPTYQGATINFYGPDQNDAKLTQVFEGVWKNHIVDDEEIPCVMGANYFIRRELFFKLGGLKQLKMWGSDEPYLSLKAWLAGYSVRIMRSVRIGHKFRTAIPGTKPPQYRDVPYRIDPVYVLYNKLRCIRTLLRPKEADFLLTKLQELHDPKIMMRALMMMGQDTVEIEEARRYYGTIFKADLRYYCRKFQIPYPE